MADTIENRAQNYAYEPASPQSGTPFPYPGNKSRLAKWVTANMKDHDRFVVPFGGAGGIFFNKKPSRNEVLNDINEDIITFYRVLRDKPDELTEYLSLVPYHEQQYNEWKTEWDRNWRPTDDIKHAAILYYLQRASFGADQTGFRAVATGRKNSATQFYNSLERLDVFSDRLQNTILHSKDYTEIITKYADSDSTLFYLDPPYTNGSERYDWVEFEPGRFSKWMAKLDGDYPVDWILSSVNVPLSVRPYATIETDIVHQINNRSDTSTTTEKLILNYHPTDVTLFSGKDSSNQESLHSFS